MRFIKDLGREMSVCPCCGAELHADVISSKGEQILEIAKRMGVKIQVLGPEIPGFKIGQINEDADDVKVTGVTVTKDNVLEKFAPEIAKLEQEVVDPVEPSITAEPKAKPVTKKKTKK